MPTLCTFKKLYSWIRISIRQHDADPVRSESAALVEGISWSCSNQQYLNTLSAKTVHRDWWRSLAGLVVQSCSIAGLVTQSCGTGGAVCGTGGAVCNVSY